MKLVPELLQETFNKHDISKAEQEAVIDFILQSETKSSDTSLLPLPTQMTLRQYEAALAQQKREIARNETGGKSEAGPPTCVREVTYYRGIAGAHSHGFHKL